MKTAISHLLLIVAGSCCLGSPARSDSLNVAAESTAVTTPERAHQIALAYTGFDSTARTDIVLKRFRLATTPMTDSAGNEIIKESNLWLVTFYQLEVTKSHLYRDYKVFIDPTSGLLVELYSVPLDTITPTEDGRGFADENCVADIAGFHAAAPPPIPFIKAIQHTVGMDRVKSRQISAICEMGSNNRQDTLGPPPIWSIWASGVFTSFGGSALDGKFILLTCEVNARTGAPWLLQANRRAPYETGKRRTK